MKSASYNFEELHLTSMAESCVRDRTVRNYFQFLFNPTKAVGIVETDETFAFPKYLFRSPSLKILSYDIFI